MLTTMQKLNLMNIIESEEVSTAVINAFEETEDNKLLVIYFKTCPICGNNAIDDRCSFYGDIEAYTDFIKNHFCHWSSYYSIKKFNPNGGYYVESDSIPYSCNLNECCYLCYEKNHNGDSICDSCSDLLHDIINKSYANKNHSGHNYHHGEMK